MEFAKEFVRERSAVGSWRCAGSLTCMLDSLPVPGMVQAKLLAELVCKRPAKAYAGFHWLGPGRNRPGERNWEGQIIVTAIISRFCKPARARELLGVVTYCV